jgi:hypothetical protein
MDKLHQFYCSRSWRDLSHMLKIRRGGKCARCGFVAATKDEWAQLIGHHKVELTEENITDAAISLNPELVEVICLNCHNKEHRRFGYSKKVYIIWGSPLAGKSTAVRDMMKYGDIVLDIDSLWQAVTFQPEHIKPDNVRFNIFALRDALLDQIKTRYGSWCDAYVIGGYPEAYERELLASSLGGELIYCESTEEECLRRRIESGRPAVWDEYIQTWWSKFERDSAITAAIPPGLDRKI